MNPDYAECMRLLTEDYLPNIAEHVSAEDMAVTFWRVNLLRRASKDAVYLLLELEQSPAGRDTLPG